MTESASPQDSSPATPVPQPAGEAQQQGGLHPEITFEQRYQEVHVRTPFLPPALLAEYKKVGIEPKKLLQMVEKAAESRVALQKSVLNMEDGDRIEKNRIARRGQTIAGILGGLFAVALGLGFVVAPAQTAEVAKVAGPWGLTGLAAVFLGARWIDKKTNVSALDGEVAKLRARVERLEQGR